MNSTLTPQQLDHLAWKISDGGLETIPAAVLRELGFEARRAGVGDAVARTLADASAPVVARQRAFGHITAKLAAGRRGNGPARTDRPAA